MAIRKIDIMHRQFGRIDDRQCGYCRNLATIDVHGKKYRKCTVYGETSSEASDWAKYYPACGMYNTEYHGRPVIDLVKRRRPETKPEEEPIEGQMEMEV